MTSTTICLTSENVGVFHVKAAREDAIKATNKYLQANHEDWHILFNATRGLHNHQVHYLLTDIALGASVQQIKDAFENNTAYQRPIDAGDESKALSIDEKNPSAALGQPEYYRAWLAYFEAQVAKKGSEDVLNEYLFARSPEADDLLGRMYEGAIHPLIHLGFGIEFGQPAIIAEALAQGAIHRFEAGEFLLRAEKLSDTSHAQANSTPSSPPSSKSIVQLLAAARANPTITNAECWKGGSFEQNGNFFRVMPENLVKLAAAYRVEPRSEEALAERLAESSNAAAWFTAAAQRPDKQVKFDFFYMHCVTSSIFLSVFAAIRWLSLEARIRLLEWKVRFDLVVYVCQGSPELRTGQISDYKPRRPDGMDWERIIERAKTVTCDGHVVKMIRALNHACNISRPYETRAENAASFPVKRDMWLKVANMALDSTEDHPGTLEKWMRGPGFDRAWDVVPDRK